MGITSDEEVDYIVVNDEPITGALPKIPEVWEERSTRQPNWERQDHEDVFEWIARTTQLGYKIRFLSTFEIGELILELKHMPEHRVKITQIGPDQYNVQMWRLP